MKKSTKSTFILVLMTLGFTIGFLVFVVQSGSAWYWPTTFIVTPSGDDDTDNIQAAFDAAIAAGPRSRVQLTAGQFYASNILVQNFNGVFKGAGKDLTKIDTLRGLDPTRPGIKLIQTDPDDPSTLYPFSVWFLFEDCNIEIRDLCFEITAVDPAEPWQAFYTEFNHVANIIRIAGHSNSEIRSVRFKAYEGNADGNIIGSREYLNEPGGYMVSADPVYGKHKVSSCLFEDTMTGFCVAGLVDGTFKFKRNILNNIGFGLWFIDNFGSILECSYNDIYSSAEGILIFHGDVPLNEVDPDYLHQHYALYLIKHNTIQATFAGIELMDFGLFNPSLDSTIKAVIYCNKIIQEEESFAGIYGFWVHSTIVICNEFIGAGNAGICIGIDDWPGDWVPCTNWFLLGNDLSNFQAYMAPIWLGPGTSNCFVIGRNTAETVLDEGTDNTIINFPLFPWLYH